MRAPLIEAELWKEEIRALSRELGLPTWDKPSFACLSSRFQYGDAITAEKLRQIDAAEAFVRSLGFRQFRVRHHDRLARIELPAEEMPRLWQDGPARRDRPPLPRAGLPLRDARPAGLPQRQRERGPHDGSGKSKGAAGGGRGRRARPPSRRSPGCATLPYDDLRFARVDLHRSLRHGVPEAVFCQGKTPEQVVAIVERLAAAPRQRAGHPRGARRWPRPWSRAGCRAACTRPRAWWW